MKVQYMLVALAAIGFSANAAAQNMKPGLWEVTNNMKSGSGDMEKQRAEMQKQMASMPPSERKMIEDMMAKQGIKMGAAGPGSMTTKMCVTKEMAERNEVPSDRGDCKTTKNERKGNTTYVAFTCANPPSSGEGQHTVVSPEAYTTKMTVRSTVQGKPDTTTMEMAGKWLGSDCGSIKPPARPPAK